MYRDYIDTRLVDFPIATHRLSEGIVRVSEHVYLAIVPRSPDLAVPGEHISMLVWAVSDAAACSVMENSEVEENPGILPVVWARRGSFAQYGELVKLPGKVESASYNGTTGKFVCKTVSFSDQEFKFAGAAVEPHQLPSVVCIIKA
jgi:hypothetical protein